MGSVVQDPFRDPFKTAIQHKLADNLQWGNYHSHDYIRIHIAMPDRDHISKASISCLICNDCVS